MQIFSLTAMVKDVLVRNEGSRKSIKNDSTACFLPLKTENPGKSVPPPLPVNMVKRSYTEHPFDNTFST